MGDWLLRVAEPTDAPAVSDLALRSKAHWGYDAEFLEACRAELTTDAAECDGVHVVVAERGRTLLGYYKLAGRPPRGELADLFVDVDAIGHGLGKALLVDATRRAHGLGHAELVIEADPNAEAFYLRHGAQRIGSVPSGSVQGRSLPLLLLRTEASPTA